MTGQIKSTIIEVALIDLLPSPHQPRIDESEGIEELQESIQMIGLINKPKVIIHETLAGKYVIQTGHRRVRAMRGLSYQTTEVELLAEEDDRVPLVDNMLRVDLHVIELANSIYDGIKEEIFLDIQDVSNATGIPIKEVEDMMKYGNAFPSYIVSHLLNNKKMVYSESPKILVALAKLAKMKPGKKILMEVMTDIHERELESGANIQLFENLIEESIEKATPKKDIEKKIDKEEKEEKEEQEQEQFSGSFLDNDEEILIEDETGSEEIMLDDHTNSIKDLGILVHHDDDWREITLKININEISKASTTKMLSILEKIKNKLEQ